MMPPTLILLLRHYAETRWSADRIARHHDRHLPSAVRAAYQGVKTYRARFDAAGVHPNDIRRAADLIRLPPLSKLDFRSLPPADRLAAGIDARACQEACTSGTSGIPLYVLMTHREMRERKTAFMLAQHLAGLPVFAHRLVVGSVSSQRVPGLMGRLRHRCGAADAVAELLRLRPAVVAGYPSQLELMLENFQRSSERPPPLRAIYSGGEMLDPPLKSALEAFFDTRVADLYGTTELGVNTIPCPEGGFHLFSPWHIIECANEGRPAPPGEEGDMLVTDLRERAMPLIRYAIGDRIALPAERCACRTAYPRFLPRTMRKDDYLHSLDGRRVAGMPFSVLLTRPGIRRYRVTERSAGDILIEVECEGILAEESIAAIKAGFGKLLGAVRIEWLPLPEIPPHPSGKERRIISLVRSG